jgi:hypothetical protein
MSIRFTANGVAITGHMLGRVADALESGRIDAVLVASLPNGFEGQYVQRTNRFEFLRLPSSVFDRGLIVHEAVHAALDMIRTNLTAVDEEAVS